MLQGVQLHHIFPHLAQASQVTVWVWFLRYHSMCLNSSGTGVLVPATSLLHLPPCRGSREEAQKLLGLHFTTACIMQVAGRIPCDGEREGVFTQLGAALQSL